MKSSILVENSRISQSIGFTFNHITAEETSPVQQINVSIRFYRLLCDYPIHCWVQFITNMEGLT